MKTIGLLCPFAASTRAQHTASTRAQRDYCAYLQIITNCQQSMTQSCQIASKKLQISFVQNTETLID